MILKRKYLQEIGETSRLQYELERGRFMNDLGEVNLAFKEVNLDFKENILGK